MCAINPAHKKRFILDVYTSDSSMTREKFNDKSMLNALTAEQWLNSNTGLRWHVKETEQEAD